MSKAKRAVGESQYTVDQAAGLGLTKVPVLSEYAGQRILDRMVEDATDYGTDPPAWTMGLVMAPVTLRFINGRGRQRAYYNPRKRTINLKPHGRTLADLMHEMAHHLNDERGGRYRPPHDHGFKLWHDWTIRWATRWLEEMKAKYQVRG